MQQQLQQQTSQDGYQMAEPQEVKNSEPGGQNMWRVQGNDGM